MSRDNSYFPKTRLFDGKQYRLYSKPVTHSWAKKDVENIRARGYLARIITREDRISKLRRATQDPKSKLFVRPWAVYARRKEERKK